MAFRFNEQQQRHFRNWGEPFNRAVDGHVGHLKQSVAHLWHGDLQHRSYRKCFHELGSWQFDPQQDIALEGETGCWRWNSEKPGLHQSVRDYYLSRREDD